MKILLMLNVNNRHCVRVMLYITAQKSQNSSQIWSLQIGTSTTHAGAAQSQSTHCQSPASGEQQRRIVLKDPRVWLCLWVPMGLIGTSKNL